MSQDSIRFWIILIFPKLPIFLSDIHKTVRIEIKGTEFGGTFYYNRTDHVFFQSLGEKNERGQLYVTLLKSYIS